VVLSDGLSFVGINKLQVQCRKRLEPKSSVRRQTAAIETCRRDAVAWKLIATLAFFAACLSAPASTCLKVDKKPSA
jgi:hypothetical protein